MKIIIDIENGFIGGILKAGQWKEHFNKIKEEINAR